MTETLDATARLADGMPGVTDIQQYVLACQCLGYQHPDLTAHPAQVHDWYATEDGMDLGALETDCVALQAAAAAAEDALARQNDQLSTLAAAWQGGGANASREFLRRHGEASAFAATALRTAAHAFADLRDHLWQSVDGKVARVLTIGDGAQARRTDWLAASQVVTTGAGDRAAASELIDQEVKPFVDNVIGGDWVAAMRAAVGAVQAAYEAASAQIASEAEAIFDVPGALGPAWSPSPSADGVVPTSPAGTATAPAPSAAFAAPAPVAPAAWGGTAAAAPPPVGPPPPVAAPLPNDSAMAQPTAAPPLPSLGGGLPDTGSGLSGFGQQLRDLLGGIIGGSPFDDSMAVDDPLDTADIGESEAEEGSDVDESDQAEDQAEEDGETDEAEDVEEESEEPVEPAVAESACPPEPVPAAADDVPADEPVPTPPPQPLGVTSTPLPEGSDAGTPCEIAADELPQVGE